MLLESGHRSWRGSRMKRKPSFGRLEPAELRACWQSEASDFTPWLAEPENIQLLAEALGLPALQVEETEATVGPFRADILCSEPDSDGYVLIENQLERTDHRHLGQILTYAAGLDAVKVVWVSLDSRRSTAQPWTGSTGFHPRSFSSSACRLSCGGSATRRWLLDSTWSSNPTSGPSKSRRALGQGLRSTRQGAASISSGGRGCCSTFEAADWPFRLLYDVPKSGSWSSVAGTPPCIRLVISHALKEQATRIYVLFRNALGKKTEEAREWFEFAHKQGNSRLPRRFRRRCGGHPRMSWATSHLSALTVVAKRRRTTGSCRRCPP